MEKIRITRNEKRKGVQVPNITFISWLFIISFCFQSLHLSAQTPLLNLSMKKVSLHEILKEIKNQSGINIVYNNNLIDKYVDETVNLKDAKLEDALIQVLEGKELNYKIVDDVIVIEPKAEKPKTEKSTNLFQRVKGTVFDIESNTPLIGASVMLMESNPAKGGATDLDGNYKIERVLIGRYNIQISYIGYEPTIVSEVLVTSGKEVVINIGLKQAITQMKEVTVKPNFQKNKPLNNMAPVSARSFSVEEAQRYAGGIGDPGRMVSAFAGAIPISLDDNAVSIRGQSPKNVKYRLEGVEIPNPNHFGGVAVAGGGYYCLISNQLMGNSDFFTGAFPAEYGNATAGIFDLKLRTGNSDKREYTVQAGLMGIDVALEGPIIKNKNASYNINYKYSTMGILRDIGIMPADQAPKFQDLSFKINLPAKKAGIFSVWGIGGIDNLKVSMIKDSSKWKANEDRESVGLGLSTGVLGLSHKLSLGTKSYINSSIVLSGTKAHSTEEWIDDSLKIRPSGLYTYNTSQITCATLINHKFNSRFTVKTGVNFNTLFYNIDLNGIENNDPSTYHNFVKAQNSSYLWQAYFQSKYKLSENLIFQAGIHTDLFTLNRKYSIEPRFGISWNITPKHSISIGYGKHSQLEEIRFYFITKEINNQTVLINKNLDFSKAEHFVLGYDFNINDDVRLKIEPYYERLYNVPGKPNSNYSLINFSQDWAFSDSLQNNSSGVNYGIDFTFERFFKNGYYYLVTASIFDSKYTGSDGITRNTLYNNRFVTNFLIGKEYSLKKRKNNFLGVNVRLNMYGGERNTPILWDESNAAKERINDEKRLYEIQNRLRFYLAFNIQYRINKENYSSIWTLDLMNILPFMSTTDKYHYDYKEKRMVKFVDEMIFAPFFSYKIEF